jgi:hypothetical protein
MKGFVGVTDNDWFAFVSQQPRIVEVNFYVESVGSKATYFALSYKLRRFFERRPAKQV